MLAARLDTEISFEKETTTSNDIGTPVETYVFLKKKWSTVTYTGGRTIGEEHADRTITDTVFTIRYDEDVNYKCRILYNNCTYFIKHIEIIGRKVGMRIKTEMIEINE